MKNTAHEFSTIGSDDGLDEARKRLENVEALVVWGKENILGVLLSTLKEVTPAVVLVS